MKLFLICVFILTTSKSFAAQILNFSDLQISSNFNITQDDSDLKPYFSQAGKSELCIPTSLAQYLIYEMGVTNKLPITTKVPGVSSNLKSIDANALIVDLSKKCKTNYDKGTSTNNLMVCIGEAIKDYYGKKVSVKRVMKGPNIIHPDYVQWEERNPDITDIAEALKNGSSIIATVNWNKFDPETNRWVYNGAHAVGIYAHSSEKYFENNVLQLQVMDPLSIGEVVTTIRRNDNPETSVFLDGRGFLGSLAVISIE